MSEELGVLGVITPPLYREVDEECFHVCNINVTLDSVENLYIKRLGYTFY